METSCPDSYKEFMRNVHAMSLFLQQQKKTPQKSQQIIK